MLMLESMPAENLSRIGLLPCVICIAMILERFCTIFSLMVLLEHFLVL